MKKLFKKIWIFLSVTIWGGAKKFAKFVDEHVDDAIFIAGKIREFVTTGGVVTNLLDLLPEKWKGGAQEGYEKVLEVLSKSIDDLNILEACLAKESLTEKINCMLVALKGRSPLDLNGAIQKLATAMVMNADDTNIPEHIADAVVVSRLTQMKNSDALSAINHEGHVDDDEESDVPGTVTDQHVVN